MSQHSNGNPKQKEQAKNLRLLRMQISQTKWLVANAHLSGNKIVFKTQDLQEVVLTAALISKTQRNIYQVRKFKKLASQLIKDVDGWLSESVSLLEKYKILNEVPQEKIKNDLKKNTKERDKRELPRLLPYLEVEANCLNVNEYPLCRALLKSPQASFALENFLFEYNHTEEAKALAALILGVLNRHERKNISHLIKRKQLPDWLRQCYNWGMNNQFPAMPVVSIFLLRNNAKAEIIKSLDSHTKSKLKIKLLESAIKNLINKGFTPSELSKTIKAMPGLNIAFEQLLDLKAVLPPGNRKKDRELKESLTQEHVTLASKLVSLAPLWISESKDSDAPGQISRLINAVLALDTANNISNLKEIIYVLETGLKLEAELRSFWIDTVCQITQILWRIEELKKKPYRELKKRVVGPNQNTIDHTAKILTLTKDTETTISIMDLWLSSEFLKHQITDLEIIKTTVTWLKKMEVARNYDLEYFIKVISQFSDAQNLREKIGPLIDIICDTPQSNRDHVLEALFENLALYNATVYPVEDIIEVAPEYIKEIEKNRGDNCPCWYLTKSLFILNMSKSKHKNELLKTLILLYKMNSPVKFDNLKGLLFSTELATAAIDCLESGRLNEIYLASKKLKLDPVSLFKSIVSSSINQIELDNTDFASAGMKEVSKHPELMMLIIDKIKIHPNQVKEFIYNLGILKRFDPSATARLKKIRRFTDIEDTARSTKTVVAKGWKPVLDKVPELKPLILSYIIARSITKEDTSPPPSIMKVLDLKDKLQEEKRYLESFSHEEKQPASIEIRLKNLNNRIKDQKQIDEDITKQLGKHLFHITRQAELEALSSVVQEAYKYQLKKITGEDPGAIVFDSYMRNALLLTQDITENKRLLKKLIKSVIRKEEDFRFKIEANKIFLEYLEEAKVPVDIWLAARPETFMVKNIPGRKVHLKLECDPLKILEMGNYFDTCLSFGDFNSFSTVTNALDLNKRVLYAFDTRGNVIGRKLIALNTDGKLVGFNTYSSVESKEGNLELRKLIFKYIEKFAIDCNLKLSAKGEVIPLSSKHWYDDGIVAWSDEPKDPEDSEFKASCPPKSRERLHQSPARS